MSSNVRHSVRVGLLIAVVTVLALGYLYAARVLFDNTANKHWQGKRYADRKSNPWNNRMVDSCVGLLKDGDLVVRRGDDMTSYMLSMMNTEDKTYSHCGIAVMEDGKPYIYHSIGGEDNPDAKVRKEPASRWFSPANNLSFGIYRYDMGDSCMGEMTKGVKDFHQDKRLFDMDMDLKTDDKLYCSEMIYKAMKPALGDSLFVPTVTRFGHTYVGVDNLYLNDHTRLVCHIRFK